MLLPTQSRHTTLEATLPEDPEPDQVYTVPEGQIAGASYVLHVYKNGVSVGGAELLEKIQNVSGKSILSRTWSSKEIKKGDRLEIHFCQYLIKSVIYVEFFGWIGHEYYSEVKTQATYSFRVIETLSVGPQKEGLFLHERICLDKIKEENDAGKSKT